MGYENAASRLVAATAFVTIVASPVGVAAQMSPPSASRILSLSDAEKAEMLDRDTEASVATARTGLGDGGDAGRQIHGVFGAGIGSHGNREAYGAAAIPLGDNAGATVSFESSRYGRPH